jgi:hypothetical protein
VEFVTSPNWLTARYPGTMVPKRYWKSSGLETAALGIRRIHRYPIRFVRHPDGGALQIRPSILCVLADSRGELVVLVDQQRHPRSAEALLFMASVSGGEHRRRYLRLALRVPEWVIFNATGAEVLLGRHFRAGSHGAAKEETRAPGR